MTDQAGAHTPGPWNKDRYGCLRSPNGREVIASGLGIGLSLTGSGNPEHEANAHLIASAPAMAEELGQIKSKPSFQDRVAPWMLACFGAEISADKLERADRFLEEALELLQSGEYPRERIPALIKYVYDRAPGEPSQEVGGVMVTLAAYCLAHDLDMHEAGETELARVWTRVDQIRAKQALKKGVCTPLPVPLVDDGFEELTRLRAQKAQLVEALILAVEHIELWTEVDPQIRAAILAAEGK